MPYTYTPTIDRLHRGVIYPAGVAAIIPDDLAIALGLTDAPAPAAAVEPYPPADSLAAAVTRLEELEGIYVTGGWQAVKAIAEPLGVTKPPDGWDSSLLRIIEAEFSTEIAAALAMEDTAE